MAFDQQPGTIDLRKTFVDRFVKGFALRNYKLRNLLRVTTQEAWKNEYFREDPDELTAGRSRTVKGIPRGANYPQAVVKWEKIQTVIRKYGLEQSIPWEDTISSNIDVDRRILLRIARGVVKSVEDGIRAKIVADTDIHTITVTAGEEWDTASANIIDNLEEAEQKIAENDYDTSTLWVYVTPKDKRSVVDYLITNGQKLSKLTDDKVKARGGKIGTIGNKTFILSNSLEASESIVGVPKMAGDWLERWPLTTTVKEEEGKDLLIRAYQLGETRITDPKVLVHIKNTQS